MQLEMQNIRTFLPQIPIRRLPLTIRQLLEVIPDEKNSSYL